MKSTRVSRMLYPSMFILFLVFFSCSEKEYNNKLILKKSGKFIVDTKYDLGANKFFFMTKKQKSYLYHHVTDMDSMFLYVLDDSIFILQESHEVNIHYSKVLPLSLDSIFMFNRYTGRWILNVNNQAADSGIIPLKSDSIQYTIRNNNLYDIAFDTERIYFSIYPQVTHTEKYSTKQELIYNFKHHKIEDFYLYYPKEYRYDHRWANNGDQYSKYLDKETGLIFYSFPVLNELFTYDYTNTKKTSKINLPQSKYLSKMPPKWISDRDSLETHPGYNVYYGKRLPNYDLFIYDKYFGYYLRVVTHSQPDYIVDSLGKKYLTQYHDNPWSIMIFDKKFKLLGEQKFSAGGKYNSRFVYPSPDGVLVGVNDRKPNSPNSPTFHLFKYEYEN